MFVKLCLMLVRVLDIFDLVDDEDDDDSARLRPSSWSGIDDTPFGGGGGIGFPLLSLLPILS